MTDARKLKKRIRARAERTGERYAAARRHVVAQLDAEREATTHATAEKAAAAPATGAVSEARCIEKTGHGFAHWFAVLDRFGARRAGHTAAARHLREDHGVSAWYSQSITVAYERAHGLREVGQLCSGQYQTSASRVLPVGLERACEALEQAAERDRWLAPSTSEPRASLAAALAASPLDRRPTRARLRYRVGASVVELDVRAKDDGRSTVAVSHAALGGRAEMEALREGWRALLDAFRDHLQSA